MVQERTSYIGKYRFDIREGIQCVFVSACIVPGFCAGMYECVRAREQVCVHWVAHRGISGDLQNESYLEGHERVPQA